MPTAGADIRVEGATVRCLGPWTVQGIGKLEALLEAMAWPDSREIVLDGRGVEALDTAGIWVVARAFRDLERRGTTLLADLDQTVLRVQEVLDAPTRTAVRSAAADLASARTGAARPGP